MTEKKTRIQMLIPNELVEIMDSHAEKTFQTRNQWIIQAILKCIQKEKDVMD